MATAHFAIIAQHIRHELGTAQHSIKLAMAWLTEHSLLAELMGAAKRGVNVEVVISGHGFNKSSALFALVKSGAQVLQHPATDTGQTDFLHHKFCIIDYSTVITGSFNWSKNAGKNAENIVITREDEALAVSYLQEFQRLFLDAQPLRTVPATNWQPPALRRFFGHSPVIDEAETITSPVRFWATRLLGAPGQKTALHWFVPNGWNVWMSLLEQDTLPTQGEHETTFGDFPIDVTLSASSPDGIEEVTRVIRLQPAHTPVIELLELDRPTIVGRVMPAQLRWRVSRAESVKLEPGGQQLPLEGELTVSPSRSTTYTISAIGLGGTRKRSVSLGVFPLPILKELKVPMPTGLRIEAQLVYSATPVPSGLDVRGSRFPFVTPSLRGLQAEFLPAPTLAEIAATRGMTSPADLHLPLRPTTVPFTRWGRWKNDLLLSLEQRFAHNYRLVHVLSTIRRYYA